MSERLFIAQSRLGVGRGVFTGLDLAVGDLIEDCPAIVVPSQYIEPLDRTPLYDYYFDWLDGGAAIALGFGSLYNHSYNPNARYVTHFDQQAISFVALEAIKAGQEILVNYNADPKDQSPLWFEPVF